MHGVGNSLCPQLMVKLGDGTRFTHRNAITTFAGVNLSADQSGAHEATSTRASQSGPPELRKALFLVIDCLLKHSQLMPQYSRFMDMKRAEGIHDIRRQQDPEYLLWPRKGEIWPPWKSSD